MCFFLSPRCCSLCVCVCVFIGLISCVRWCARSNRLRWNSFRWISLLIFMKVREFFSHSLADPRATERFFLWIISYWILYGIQNAKMLLSGKHVKRNLWMKALRISNTRFDKFQRSQKIQWCKRESLFKDVPTRQSQQRFGERAKERELERARERERS